MHAHLTKLREKRANGDHGFTLIELLVVVVIIGVLVAIAIPVYLNFRKGAENRSAQSDVRNAVTSIEQCFNDAGQVYPASFGPTAAADAPVALTCGTATGSAVNISTGNTMTYTKTGTTYSVVVKNTDTNATYTYTSLDGQTKQT